MKSVLEQEEKSDLMMQEQINQVTEGMQQMAYGGKVKKYSTGGVVDDDPTSIYTSKWEDSPSKDRSKELMVYANSPYWSLDHYDPYYGNKPIDNTIITNNNLNNVSLGKSFSISNI